jgi:hypothetical protein
MSILLDPGQLQLLNHLVEAARNVPKSRREKFLAVSSGTSRNATILHQGLPGGQIEWHEGDLDELKRNGMIAVLPLRGSGYQFDVTAAAFAEYARSHQSAGDAVARVEAGVRAFLDGDRLRGGYPDAFETWQDAEALLWKSGSERELTTIGHLCREALQRFADALAREHTPLNEYGDTARTIRRIRAVLGATDTRPDKTTKAFLETLLEYWGTVNDLVQRQEHGGQREGDPLTWEDGRRVVFHTLLVMYEIDRAVSR